MKISCCLLQTIYFNQIFMTLWISTFKSLLFLLFQSISLFIIETLPLCNNLNFVLSLWISYNTLSLILTQHSLLINCPKVYELLFYTPNYIILSMFTTTVHTRKLIYVSIIIPTWLRDLVKQECDYSVIGCVSVSNHWHCMVNLLDYFT